jgi:hypothetical protein
MDYRDLVLEEGPDGSVSIRRAKADVDSATGISCSLNAAAPQGLIQGYIASATAPLRANLPGEQPSRFRNAVLNALADS